MDRDMKQYLRGKTPAELQEALTLRSGLARSAKQRAAELRRQANEADKVAKELEKEVDFVAKLLARAKI